MLAEGERFRTHRCCVHSPLRFFLHFCDLATPSHPPSSSPRGGPFSLSLSLRAPISPPPPPTSLSSTPALGLPSPPPLVRVAPHFGTQLPLVVETFSRILPRGVYPPVLALLAVLCSSCSSSSAGDPPPPPLLSLPVSHLRSPPRKGPKKGAGSGGSTESGGGRGVG